MRRSSSFLSETTNTHLRRLQLNIAYGKNLRASQLTKQFPDLLTKKEGVCDYSQRKFMPLYPLQLAAYYQNTKLCEVLRSYLPDKIAREQLESLELDGAHYTTPDKPGMFILEPHYSPDELLYKLSKVIECADQSPEKKYRALLAFGKEQQMMPPQMVMWYCSKRKNLHCFDLFSNRQKKHTLSTAEEPSMGNLYVMHATTKEKYFWYQQVSTQANYLGKTTAAFGLTDPLLVRAYEDISPEDRKSVV